MGRTFYRMGTGVQNVIAFDANYIPNDRNAIVNNSSNSASGIVQGINTAKEINNIPIYKSIFKDAAADLKGVSLAQADEAIPNFGLIKNTFLGKIFPKFAKADKTLADLQISKNAIKNVFNCNIYEAENAGELAVSGTSKTGKFLSKTLGRIPILNLALASACEIPNIKNAAKNDELGKQSVKSGFNIVIPTIASSMAGQIATQIAPKSVRTVVAVASSITAGVAANKVTNKTVDAVIGESIQQQNNKALAKLAEMKKNRATIAA